MKSKLVLALAMALILLAACAPAGATPFAYVTEGPHPSATLPAREVTLPPPATLAPTIPLTTSTPQATADPTPAAALTSTSAPLPTQASGSGEPFHRVIGPNAIGAGGSISQARSIQQTGTVNVLAFSLDDRFLVSGGDDKVVHVWNTSSGDEAAALKGSLGAVKDAAFSLDGRWLAAITAAAEVRVWEVGTWKPVQQMAVKGLGLGVKFMPDGSLLSVNTAGMITIWDVTAGKALKTQIVPRNMSTSCAGSALYAFDATDDGSLLAASLACGYGVIWKQDGGDIAFSDFNRQNDMKGRKPIFAAVGISPDGKMAAFGSVYYPKRRLILMDVIDLQQKKIVSSVSPMNLDLFATRVNPTNDLVVGGVGNQLIQWWPDGNAWSYDNYRVTSPSTSKITALEFSWNGEMLASGDYNGKIVIWKK